MSQITEHNLFLLSSSISYYSALALAPFMLILLSVASWLRADIKSEIIRNAQMTFSPQVAVVIEAVFENLKEGVNLGSLSGVVGLVILLSTSSLVFLQLRHSLDVIYGKYDPKATRPTWHILKERILSMGVVLCFVVIYIVSLLLSSFLGHFFPNVMSETGMFLFNYGIYLTLFTGIHYFTPTERPAFSHCVKIANLTALFFVLGNSLIQYYLSQIAGKSIYGAAGSLLVFLIWVYYSSFSVFLSVEVFLFFQRLSRQKN